MNRSLLRQLAEKKPHILAAGSALLLTAISATGCNLGGLADAPYKPPAVGTVYHYSGGVTNRITSVDKWRVHFVDARGDSGSRVGLFVSEDPRSPAKVAETDLMQLWPLKLNKEFTMKVERGGEVYSWNFRVTSEQTVIVAGQSFDTYVVQAVQTPVLVRDPTKAVSTVNTWWYSPDLGAVARFKTTYTGGPNGAARFESELQRIELPNPIEAKRTAAPPPAQVKKP